MQHYKPVKGQVAARVAIATVQRDGKIDDRPKARNDLLVKALQERGVSVEGASWHNPEVTWEDYDLVFVNNVIDCSFQAKNFRSWLDNLISRGIQTWNSVEVLLWNLNKTYLVDLRRHGADVADTIFMKSRDLGAESVLEILKAKGWDDAVVKPCIGGGSFLVYKVSVANMETSFADLNLAGLISQSDDVMVQEYLPSIRSQGEWSLVYFDGCLSHAVRKFASEGEFRMGISYTLRPEVAIPEEVEAAGAKAMRALASMGHETLYARADLIVDPRGKPVLTELETIDPFLYLGTEANAPQTLAKAIQRKLGVVPKK